MDKISDEKLERYFSITEEALEMAKDNVSDEESGEVVIDMVERYVSDAKHFLKGGDKVTAFAALNYAHGWLDCAARTGILSVKDDRLFTVDPEEVVE